MYKVVALTAAMMALVLFGPRAGSSALAEGQEQAAAPQGGPRIVFEETSHDFGTVGQSQSVKHVFKFKNAGDATLVISNVRTTCGCTATLLSKKELAPGEEGDVEVTFSTGTRGGPNKKSIMVYSNDPQQPMAKLDISANVLVPVEVRPPRLYWPVKRNQEAIRTIELLYVPEHKFNILELKGTSPAFTVSARPKNDGDSHGYFIDIKYDGSLPLGRYTDVITIHTDHPQYQQLRVRLDGKVEGPVTVLPDSVAIGVVQKGQIPTRTIQIFSPEKKDFEVIEIQPTSPLISAQMKKDAASNRYQVNVTLSDAPPQGTFSEKLIVKTNHPDERVVEVPVYAYVR